MSNVIDKVICLQLNKAWKPTGTKSVREAVIQLAGSGAFHEPTDMAMDIEYEIDNEGNPNFNNVLSVMPVKWDDWCKLQIRKWDLFISTANNKIRVPTVIISTTHEKMPVKLMRKIPTREDVRLRDGGICQYTGKKLDKNSATIDHIIPKSRWQKLGKKGSPDAWDNVVLCSRDINESKGNKLNSEIGLKLIKQPAVPKPIAFYELINEAKHADWQMFIKK